MNYRSFDLAIVVFATFFFVSSATGFQEASWPMFRGADGTNRSSETGLFDNWGSGGPELAWTAEGMGEGYASVSVSDGRIFTTGNFGGNQSVVATSLKGEVLWTSPVTTSKPEHGYEGSRSTPTIDGDRLYVVSSDGAIVCLNVKDGSFVWGRKFSDWGGKMMSVWGFSESPLVDGDLVLCTPGGPAGMVVALNKKNGRDVWACRLPEFGEEKGVNGKPLKDGAGYSSIVVSNGGGVKQYVQMVGRGLIGIRAKDGVPLWRYQRVANGTANIPNAVVDGDLIFTSTGYNTGSALLKLQTSGRGTVDFREVYWLDGKTLQNKHGGMTLVDGHIYCGHGNGKGLLSCTNLKSGKVTWGPERGAGNGETSLVYADGHIVFRRDDGTIILAKANPSKLEMVGNFKPVFQQGKSWAHPVIAGGMLLLREQNKLMAYRLN